MIGARFRGSRRSGGARTSDLVIAPPLGTLAFCHWETSTFSCPRCNTALPLDTTISLSLVSLSDFTAARLFGRNSALASSLLTAAFEPGELQFGVARSTAPVLMRTATLVGLLLAMVFSSTVISVPGL